MSCKQCKRYDRVEKKCNLYDDCVSDVSRCAGFVLKTTDSAEVKLETVLSSIKTKKTKRKHRS